MEKTNEYLHYQEYSKTKKRTNIKEKGITLVALVVTIIILLILAGVTLNGALSENGLFQRAKRATNEYKKAEEEEAKAIDKIGEEIDKITFTYNDYIGCYVDGYGLTEKKCTIDEMASGWKDLNETDETSARQLNTDVKEDGSQEFTTETGMQWRIWDYNKSTNTIRLISEKPTTRKLSLYGANGYNNGVWVLNHICEECYTNGDIKGISVANLRRTDIQKVSTYDYTQYENPMNSTEAGAPTESETPTHFGDKKSYNDDGHHYYPKMWGEYDKSWTMSSDKECTSLEKENNGNGTLDGYSNEIKEYSQSSYFYNYENQVTKFTNSKYYDLLFKDGSSGNYLNASYWLATRTVGFGRTFCDFQMALVHAKEGTVVQGSSSLYTSVNKVWGNGFALRPVVSINLTESNYELVKEKQDENGETRFQLTTKTE